MKRLVLLTLFLSICSSSAYSQTYFFYAANNPTPTHGVLAYPVAPTWTGSTWTLTASQEVVTSYKGASVAAVNCVDGSYDSFSAYPVVTYQGDVSFQGTRIGTSYSPITLATITSMYPAGTCPDPCAEKSGTAAGYNIETYTEGSSPDLSDQCVDGCAVLAQVHESLGPCINSQCVVSVKYTYTGGLCGGENLPLDEEPPGQCYAQWTALVNKCGGSSKVASFDWSTCTGECLKNDCSEKYDDLAQACGGYLYIASWDNTTCQGTCANFSTPSTTNGDAAPSSVSTETKTNSDGTSSTTTNTTYTIDNTTYTNTTTKTYDSSGNETGSSTTVTTGPSSDSDDSDDDSDDETFTSITSSGFGESYGTDEFDIPGRFTTFMTNVKSSGLFSFSSDFFESLPGGGSSTYEIDGGETFGGQHTIDLSETFAGGLAVIKTVLLAVFGFLSIRAIIMKR